jgi:hypothetical protein
VLPRYNVASSRLDDRLLGGEDELAFETQAACLLPSAASKPCSTPMGVLRELCSV